MVASHSVLQGGSHSPQGGPQIRALLQGAVDGCLQVRDSPSASLHWLAGGAVRADPADRISLPSGDAGPRPDRVPAGAAAGGDRESVLVLVESA